MRGVPQNRFIFLLCLLIQEWLFWRKTFQLLLPFNPYCFCVIMHITTIPLFIMIFRSEIFCLDVFCSFRFNILVCQNDLLLFILIVSFVSISTDNTIQLRHLHPKEVLYNFLMILHTTIKRKVSKPRRMIAQCIFFLPK